MHHNVSGQPATIATQHHKTIDARREQDDSDLCLQVIDHGAVYSHAMGRYDTVNTRRHFEEVEGSRGGDDIDGHANRGGGGPDSVEAVEEVMEGGVREHGQGCDVNA